MYWAKVCAEIQTHKPIYNYKYGSLTRQAFSALFSIVNNEQTGGTKNQKIKKKPENRIDFPKV